MYRRHPAARVLPFRPLLEALEERAVPSDLSLTARDFSANAGRQVTPTVARFTDPDASNTQGTFTATINWGDGQTSVGQVASRDEGERFDVTSTHTYATSGNFNVSVQVVDSDGDQASSQSTARIEAAENEDDNESSQGDLRVSEGPEVTLAPNQAFNGTVATVRDPDQGATQGTLTAVIDWGDGQTSAGTVTPNADGTFTVTGTHTYTGTGEFHYNVQVTDTDGDSGSDRGELRVKSSEDHEGNQGDLRVRAQEDITLSPNQTFTGPVATVSDPDPANTQGTLTAVINWGDGQTSAGTLTPNADGTFTVSGTHAFTGSDHEFHFTVQVTDTDGDSGSDRGELNIEARGDMHVRVAEDMSATAGQAFTGTVATITDPDTFNTQGTITAAIDWGDGQTTAGTVTPNQNGTFTVTGTHTYANTHDDEFKFIVQAADTDGDTASDHGEIHVRNNGGDPPGDPPANPALTTSASSLFVVDHAGNLFERQGNGWQGIGSSIQSITSALDSTGQPVVFAVTTAHDLARFDAQHGWSMLGSSILSASSNSTGSAVFVVTAAHDLFRLDASGWQKLGSFIDSLSVAQGTAGQPVVYAVTSGHDLFRLDASRWQKLGSFISSISAGSDASGNPVVFVVTQAADLFRFDQSHGWSRLGGSIQSVTAGTDANGRSDTIVLTKAGDLFRNDAQGLWTNLQPPVRMNSILSALADQVFSLGSDGSVYELADSGWTSLGTPS